MLHKVRSWMEINTNALKHNLRQFKKVVSRGTKIMAVVKSNAYGHGMVECAKLFEKWGTDWFGVDDLDDAIALRKAGVKKPILVFGYTLPNRYLEAAKNNISITVSSLAHLKRLLRIKDKGLRIHLKVDTGLHRQGISLREVSQAYDLILKNNRIVLEAVYSHFAAAENPEKKSDVAFTKSQIEKFRKVVEQFREVGFNPLTHIAGTAAILLYPESHFNMVRIGIGLYGLWPSEATRKKIHSSILQNTRIDLRPVLNWKSVVSEVKRVKKDEAVGYDLTEKLKRDSKLAIVPVGYWHGYPRHLSNKGFVVVRDVKCKIIGRVSMDMMIIDVTNVKNIREGDEVTLIGSSGRVFVTADELARIADTINYEIVTRINPLLPRKFL